MHRLTKFTISDRMRITALIHGFEYLLKLGTSVDGLSYPRVREWRYVYSRS